MELTLMGEEGGGAARASGVVPADGGGSLTDDVLLAPPTRASFSSNMEVLAIVQGARTRQETLLPYAHEHSSGASSLSLNVSCFSRRPRVRGVREGPRLIPIHLSTGINPSNHLHVAARISPYSTP
jgi:hypothetical protein